MGKEVPHPNTIEHHIAWVQLFGVKQDGQVISLGRADFAPGYTSPNVSFQVPVAQFKAFCALGTVISTGSGRIASSCEIVGQKVRHIGLRY